jgi:hypothetical protein
VPASGSDDPAGDATDPDHPARSGEPAARPTPSPPIDRFPAAEHLYSATGLPPADSKSASLARRGRISRQGLAEHRGALMSIAWGLSRYCRPFRARDHEFCPRGMAPIQARVALARHACWCAYALLRTQNPYDDQRYRRAKHQHER